ncbi:unnamed protein product [Closterium sp. NIES-54]
MSCVMVANCSATIPAPSRHAPTAAPSQPRSATSRPPLKHPATPHHVPLRPRCGGGSHEPVVPATSQPTAHVPSHGCRCGGEATGVAAVMGDWHPHPPPQPPSPSISSSHRSSSSIPFSHPSFPATEQRPLPHLPPLHLPLLHLPPLHLPPLHLPSPPHLPPLHLPLLSICCCCICHRGTCRCLVYPFWGCFLHMVHVAASLGAVIT